jgi:hypothetical protein
MCLLYDCCMFASMDEKVVWDNANPKHFIDICKEEIGVGNRPNGCFTRNCWKNPEEKFFARSGLKLVKSQLKNKLHNMKKDYTIFIGLHNCIGESQLRDKEFERCDTDDEYMPGASNNEDVTEDVDEEEEGMRLP